MSAFNFFIKIRFTKNFNYCVNKKLNKTIIKWKKEYALSVVMVNKGYPGKYKKNNIIKNLNLIKEDMNTKIFHSGTSLDTKNNIIATGGRVLSVTSKNKNFNIAKKKVYEVVRRLKWKNSFFRKDIGYRAKKLK